MELAIFGERTWWKGLLVVLVVGVSGVAYMGVKTYQDAPPIPDFVGPDGASVASQRDVLAGQTVFLRRALMDYGSLCGDGAGREPDYSGWALHEVALARRAHHTAAVEARTRGAPSGPSPIELHGVEAQVARELKANRYDPGTNRVALCEAQVHAFGVLRRRLADVFGSDDQKAFTLAGYITDPLAPPAEVVGA